MDDMKPQGQTAPHDGPGHEVGETKIQAILGFGLALVVITIVAQLLLAGLMAFFHSTEARSQARRPALFDDETGLFPGARLQENPKAEMDQMRRDQEAHLSRYGWVEKDKVAHIPIDRAMDLLVKTGLPKQDTQPPTSPPGQAVESERNRTEAKASQ